MCYCRNNIKDSNRDAILLLAHRAKDNSKQYPHKRRRERAAQIERREGMNFSALTKTTSMTSSDSSTILMLGQENKKLTQKCLFPSIFTYIIINPSVKIVWDILTALLSLIVGTCTTYVRIHKGSATLPMFG